MEKLMMDSFQNGSHVYSIAERMYVWMRFYVTLLSLPNTARSSGMIWKLVKFFVILLCFDDEGRCYGLPL
jgi:hypothetical protein